MAGFYYNAVKRVFRGASDIKEDWDNRTVTFEIIQPTGEIKLEFNEEALEALKKTFGTTNFSICSKGTAAYYEDDGETGVTVKITLMEVSFPARPN